MKSRSILFVVALAFWFLLSMRMDWQHVVAGVAVALIVTALTGGMFTRHPFKFKGIRRYVLFVGWYVPVFLWELVKANLDVAYRVIHPALPIAPGIVRVKTTLTGDTAITFLANSITLTPGTLTVDVDRKNGYLFVHWINVRTASCDEATRYIVSRFERILKEIFE